tara:strand:- start:62 stop:391 length:330 start_codon:yes stop_codon:yes gene_type:complete
MKVFLIKFLIILLTYIVLPNQVKAETKIKYFINDFYIKSNEAIQILKEIENELKDGSRQNVCARQRKAARLGLSANESLIKAFQIDDSEVPINVLNKSQKRWESLLNKC